MDNKEKIRIAITAGIVALILLIMVLFLALSGKNKNDDEKTLDESISNYANSGESVSDSSSISSTESSSEEAIADATSDSSADASSVMSYSEFSESQNDTGSQDRFFETETAILKNVYNGLTYDIQSQLHEMYTYWSDNNTEAVRDLAHLERFEVMSYELGDTNNYYYYGDTNSEGLPDGTGLAVYANDQYYFGQWSNGVRSGNGTWIAFYPSYSKYVVTEHMYSGEWADDLPCGEGQEHYDYDSKYMNDSNLYLQNAIGSFSNGLYNGDMYIITVNKEQDTTEWLGTCTNGTWEQIINTTKDKKGNTPVLNARLNSDNHIYLSEEGIKDNGVSGIITGGNVIE